jgi:C_GCAxxG_C_C family probable redox protein
MVKYTLDERITRARQLHKEGYNCAQCVVMVFDDIYDLDTDTAAKVSAGMGGGVGGQRQVCGTVSGMAMTLGLVQYASPADKATTYQAAKDCSNEFTSLNGSIVCSDLLKPGRKPCIELIVDAITIIDKKLR